MARLVQSREVAQSSTGLSKGQGVWTGSPMRRRVTRSQSRELEELRTQQAPRGSGGDDGEPSAGAGRRRWGTQSKGPVSGKGLDVVVEESPQRSAQKTGPQYGNQVIPETPEDEHNISGTTILPSEPDHDLDVDIMVEALPDLERAAANVLDFLVPGSADPVSIMSRAKQLRDPAGTQSRRLQRSVTNLNHEAKYFGQKSPLTYLDVEYIVEVSGLEDYSKPVLYKANCARFALRMLLATPGTESSPEQAISTIHDEFPSPFMANLVERGAQKSVDESYLEKETWQLALEIRTQYLIMQLEAHQNDDDFDPVEILTTGFFLDAPKDAPSDAERRFRGFNLERFTDARGELPSKYRSDVESRYDDMRVVLEVDGTIGALKGDYRWQKFVMQAARWIRKRCDEVNNDLKGQISSMDMHESFYAIAKSRQSISGTPALSTPSGRFSNRLSTTENTARRSATTSGTPQVSQPSSQARPPATASTNAQKVATPMSAQNPFHTVPEIIEPERSAPRVASVARDVLPPAATEGPSETRPQKKFRKYPFNNRDAIARMGQRRQELRHSIDASTSRRQSDPVRPNASEVVDQSAADRRQTVSAIPPRQRSADPAPPSEVQTTFDASRTLVNDETQVNDDTEAYEDTQLNDGNETHEETQLNDEHTTAEDTELFVCDEPLDISQHTENHPERSHSPPMNRSVPRPRRETGSTLAPPRMENNLSLPSSRDVWNMANSRSRATPEASNSSRPAFIDRQENAVCVSPVSQTSGPRSVERRPRGRPPKRRRETETVSESEEEYDTDNREVATERRRAEKPEQARQSKRARVDSGHEGAGDEAQVRHRSRSQEAAGSPVRTQTPSPQAENRQAMPPPVPKRRTRGWTDAEDRRLIRLIEEHGVSWTKIEDENTIQPEREGEARFENRNQVQIKDRARNLRIKFLRESQPIPKNFVDVTMKGVDKKKLRDQGIDPDRRE
ncbi:uncharacterized protein AKAW2_11150S [Aspergillus luchuensis]|uniref:Uncharacterized protein n=1 Tax=Aspergillus kawachii TaxID=1069201 RepID=A0A7R7W152_ASPKA|nr:uncharacterized protein AKAW2_11150S [Aspergillus luchuensis]BCR94104.1 hypothetical protein AKAW2_11150S [Aspergillus luchuensis]BCS06714.1 hypothetical protein ALUC_11095S [Aspergillus luchuensis]GAA84275.1 Myb-like DNA-binding protein [Aspergillus luchuensis IFO 4308]